MITQKTISVYKFEDLNTDAKQKAINKHREINVDYDWYEPNLYDLVEQIKEEVGLSLDKKEIYFEFMSRDNSIYLNGEVVVSALCEKYPEIYKFFLPKKFGCFCNYLGGGLCSGLNYSEVNMDYLEIEEDTDKLRAMNIKKAVENDLYKLHTLLEKAYVGLYDSYNYLVSDEAVADTLINNEYEFEENGECL